MLGLLQIAFIRPYYRNSKVQTINHVASLIQSFIIDNPNLSDEDLQNSFQVTLNNNVCALIYNDQGRVVYSVDSLGAGCLFTQNIQLKDVNFKPNDGGLPLVEALQDSLEYSFTLDNSLSGQEMIVYGKKIKSNLSNYYLYVNSPLEPVDSIVSFILDQYIYFTAFVLILAFGLAFYIASRISKPIVMMKNSANRLSFGKYDTRFYGNSYTEINDLAETLNDATLKLSQVDELRKDLIANVSHDIKTPLTMIKAYAEMIKDISGDFPIKRNEHLDVIIKETDYLDHLILDMQALSKMQAGVVVLNRHNFDLTSKISEILQSFEVLISQNELELVMDLQINVFVYADEIKLSQVIYNFVSNAIKNTDEKGQVRLVLTCVDDLVHFEVQDTGNGINEKDMAHIWDRYYKIDKQFARKEKGTGLGLAITKEILEAHGARYGVNSEVKKGSTFWFEFRIGVIDEKV